MVIELGIEDSEKFVRIAKVSQMYVHIDANER